MKKNIKDIPVFTQIYKGLMLVILILVIASCSNKVIHQAALHPEYVRINADQGGDAEISSIISPYKKQLTAIMDTVIGQVEKQMVKKRPNSALSNWLADVILDVSNAHYDGKVDFAIQNYGGIRIPSIAGGDLSVRQIYELMPFDNEISVLTIDGETTQKLFNAMAIDGGWPISAKTSFKIGNQNAIDIIIAGQPFDSSKNYNVAMPDYIAGGGSDCDFLLSSPRNDLGVLIRDALIDHTKRHTHIPYNNEKRIIVK